MEQIILQILNAFRRGEKLDERGLVKLINAQVKHDRTDRHAYAKRRLLPYCQRVRREDPERWASWEVAPDLERALYALLRMKPRRSASGVATITVITKPWPCSGSCLFCPSDVRMPKSYLHDEPACARAEQNYFDPYLQVASRLAVLSQMGHAIDKIELIVLGGTWSDYPQDYQIWFVSELYRAINEQPVWGGAENPDEPCSQQVRDRRGWYASEPDPRVAITGPRAMGWPVPAAATERAQRNVDAGRLSYNEAVRELYGTGSACRALVERQRADLDELDRRQHENETAASRVVGLVIETRPDAVTAARLRFIRRLGCTKVQLGIQSLDQAILDANNRSIPVARIERACSMLRLFGFKIHVHFMVNLLGATPGRDRDDYAHLMGDPSCTPDEVKLYPCALIAGTPLADLYDRGRWRPYTEEELLGVLEADILATPAQTRVSRMIRDFSAGDIMAGNRKSNLRQLVEARLDGSAVQEIRFREIGVANVDVDALRLDIVSYECRDTSERFLQWLTPQSRIAGFLRLSLPRAERVADLGDELPIHPGEAMIREVHVYGTAQRLEAHDRAAQHRGLGRRLVERACAIAREQGYTRMNVISAVGTRGYYRRLGFSDAGLYQSREL